MSDDKETARQRLARNLGEDIRVWRARAVEEERAGNTEAAAQIRKIADAWAKIEAKAQEGGTP